LTESSTNTIGKYQIVREIARSNDVVYEAIDPSISRRVAVKELCIPPNLTGDDRRERIERFWREGKAAGRLSHPNIVTVFEVGKDGDRYFIAMELLEGQSLRDVLKARGALPIQDAVNYALQISEALSYAHRNGVIHRDIKPENVHVLPGGHIKITDFGIARLIGEASITQDGQVFGTPSYMSPEQVSGKSIDIRSDIFSLGVVLYEMVVGKKPFIGDTVVTITYNIMNLEAPTPAGVPPNVSTAIRKAMAKDPADRFSSADDMAEALSNDSFSDPAHLLQPTGVTGGYGSPSRTYSAPGPPTTLQNQSYTPYGTPMPSPSSGGSAGPFSYQSTPVTPPKPILSAETRHTLGIGLLSIGLLGIFLFAIWALGQAYKSYISAAGAPAAENYYNQGVDLMRRGLRQEAIGQWKQAMSAAPESRYAQMANNEIYATYVEDAAESIRRNDYQSLEARAQALLGMRPKQAEGYYYFGMVYEKKQDYANAEMMYNMAVQYGENDQYAQAARLRLEAIPRPQGTQPGTPPSSAPPQPPAGNIPFAPAQPD